MSKKEDGYILPSFSLEELGYALLDWMDGWMMVVFSFFLWLAVGFA